MKKKALLTRFGERYTVIDHDGGYLLYDKEGKARRAQQLFKGHFYLSTTYPKIKDRDSCLDRKIMDSYARLVHLYNGEKFDHHAFCEYYMGKKEIPELKEE